MKFKPLGAMFIAAGIMTSVSSAWADEEIVRTRTFEPTSESTTTTTTSVEPGVTTVERSTTVGQPVVEQKTTIIEKRRHKHFFNLHAPFIHASVD